MKTKSCFLISVLLLACFQNLQAAAPAPAAPAAPQVFQLSPDFPKYVTCDVEFRDPTEVKWPHFFYGKPTTAGVINLGQSQASFAFQCDKMAQRNGDQSRRVLGELCQADKTPVIRISINALQPLLAGAPGSAGKDKNSTRARLTGTLDVDGRQVPIQALTSFKYEQSGKGDEKNASLRVESRCEIKAADLGLKAFQPNDPIQVRFGLTAYVNSTPPAGKKGS